MNDETRHLQSALALLESSRDDLSMVTPDEWDVACYILQRARGNLRYRHDTEAMEEAVRLCRHMLEMAELKGEGES